VSRSRVSRRGRPLRWSARGSVRPSPARPRRRGTVDPVEASRLDDPMTTPATPTPPEPAEPAMEPSRPDRSWRPRRRIILVGGVAVIALVLVVGAAMALRPVPFDRSLAIDRAVDASGGRLTQRQAGCYVDRVRADLGTSYLAPDAVIPTRVGARLASIRDDCVGLTNIAGSGGGPTGADVPSTEGGDQPLRHGDDAALDALWTRCASGSGPACDQLFTQSPIGSEYEGFALTCGGRTRERVCAVRYPSPGVTTPPTTATP
jgi:hypothetical protein